MAVHFFKDHKYRLFLIPSSFFLLEWVKSWMISGFPWLNLGIIFESLWGLLPIVGVSGTSFVMLLIICAIFEKNIYVKTVGPILFIGLLLFGPGHYQKISEENSDLTVTVVQPANLGLDGLIELTNKADSNIRDLENSISEKIGLNVSIKNNKYNKGSISFYYKELDQLNKIIDIIKSGY